MLGLHQIRTYEYHNSNNNDNIPNKKENNYDDNTKKYFLYCLFDGDHHINTNNILHLFQIFLSYLEENQENDFLYHNPRFYLLEDGDYINRNIVIGS